MNLNALLTTKRSVPTSKIYHVFGAFKIPKGHKKHCKLLCITYYNYERLIITYSNLNKLQTDFALIESKFRKNSREKQDSKQ